MSTKGNRKGAAFERDCCKRLSLWLSSNRRDDLLWRSSMSGGRATMAFKKGKENRAQLGDICSIDPLSARFCSLVFLDSKFYRDLAIHGMLFGDRLSGMSGFWATCVSEAARVERLPMLIAKQNFLGEFVVLDDAGIDRFQMEKHAVGYFPERAAYVAHFDAFLNHARRP